MRQQPLGQSFRIRQSNEMAAGNFLHFLAEPFTRDTPLKFDRKKAVVSSRKNVNGNLSPALEATGLTENGLGLVAWLRAVAQDVPRHVVQKIRLHIEFRRVAAPRSSLFPRFNRAGCLPPGAGGFAWLWYHRVDEYDRLYGRTRANKGSGEARQGLSDQNYVASLRNRASDDVRISFETGAPVVARQIDRDGLVSRRANERDHAVPVPSHASRPGNEDK